MFNDPEKRREISKWVIGTFTCCILIYLGMRHISSIAQAVSFVGGLMKPILTGGILALVLNVPMSMIEELLHKKTKLKSMYGPYPLFWR